jgi:plasmid replication initiation protein
MKVSDKKFREPDHIFPACLSSKEQDIFALLLCEISKDKAKLDSLIREGDKKKISEFKHKTTFSFTTDELSNVFNCTKSNVRMVLEPAAISLMQKDVGYSDSSGFDFFHPISRVRYVDGILICEMLPSVIEMIVNYKAFSEIDFKLFISLNGRYERRILREISQWKNIEKELVFTIDEFKSRLGIKDGQYSIFSNFKKRCIDEPIKDILLKSNGTWIATDENNLGYELIKSGRSYSHIRLKLKHNRNKLFTSFDETDSLMISVLESKFKSGSYNSTDLDIYRMIMSKYNIKTNKYLS